MLPGEKSPALGGNKKTSLARTMAVYHHGWLVQTGKMTATVALSAMTLSSTSSILENGGLAHKLPAAQLCTRASMAAQPGEAGEE